MTEPLSAAPPRRATLENGRPLSESRLWDWQRRYFAGEGMAAWSGGAVPHHLTSNPHLADAYARCLLGFLRDCAARGYDDSQPVYILELGAGSGRLGYRLLRRLSVLMAAARLSGLRVCYVMSDFTQDGLEQLRAHPWLQGLMNEGLLDMARFDAEHDGALHLAVSGAVLAPGGLRNPLAVVANYVFDSLPQDAFRLENGELFDMLSTLTSPQHEPDPDDPGLLMRVEQDFETRPAGAARYGDPRWNALLEQYRSRLPDLDFTFPLAALGCVDRLLQLAGGDLLLLSGDRGYHTDTALAGGAGAPTFARHGSISMLVDYQLLGAFAERAGGAALLQRHAHRSLDVCVLLFGAAAEQALETRAAFDDISERFGPDDFCTLKEGVERVHDDFTLDELLAFLRLSRWDHLRFTHALPLIHERLSECGADQRDQLADAVHLTWENYFPIGEAEDLAFEMGVLLLELGLHDEALLFFGYSAASFGEGPGTAYNRALCHYGMGQGEAALRQVDLALAAAPEMDDAHALRAAIVGGL